MSPVTPAACPPQAVCGIFAADPRGTEPWLASREGHKQQHETWLGGTELT